MMKGAQMYDGGSAKASQRECEGIKGLLKGVQRYDAGSTKV